MVECDLHIHSIRSSCGFHTFLEIVDIMKERGMRGFALTDHGPLHKTPRAHFSVLLRRIPRTIKGIRVIKGIESTIFNEQGDIDLPVFKNAPPFEIVLAGIHEYGEFAEGSSIKKNTMAVVNAMKRYPQINVITHPFFDSFPLDLEHVTDVAIETNTALEINNSYILTGKADIEALERFIEIAGKRGNPVCLSSDGHTFNEMGNFELAQGFIEKSGMKNLRIINRTLESTLDFLGLEE